MIASEPWLKTVTFIKKNNEEIPISKYKKVKKIEQKRKKQTKDGRIGEEGEEENNEKEGQKEKEESLCILSPKKPVSYFPKIKQLFLINFKFDSGRNIKDVISAFVKFMPGSTLHGSDVMLNVENVFVLLNFLKNECLSSEGFLFFNTNQGFEHWFFVSQKIHDYLQKFSKAYNISLLKIVFSEPVLISSDVELKLLADGVFDYKMLQDDLANENGVVALKEEKNQVSGFKLNGNLGNVFGFKMIDFKSENEVVVGGVNLLNNPTAIDQICNYLANFCIIKIK